MARTPNMPRVSRARRPGKSPRQDILSRKKHPLLWLADGPTKVNERLHQAVLAAPAFPTDDSIFRLTLAHFSTGPYEKGMNIGWHEHSVHQVEVAVSGEFQFETRQAREVLRPGDALLIAPGTEHRWRAPGGGAMLGIDLHRSPIGRKLVSHSLVQETGMTLITSERVRHAASLVSTAAVSDRYSDLERLMIECGVAALVASVCAEAFPPTAGRAECVATSPANDYYTAVIDRTCRHLIDNLGRKIERAELKQVSGLTHRHLNRLFHQHVGQSVHQFLINARLMRAEEMFHREPGLLVKEVAYACGFSSASHLSMAMKQRHGWLPSELSKNNGSQ